MPINETFIDSPLNTFLSTHRVEKGEQCTFTGMNANMKGRWNVRDDEYPQFLDLLNEHLFVQKKRPLNFVEQRRLDGYSPILIDLDFKYTPENAIERRFNLSNIRAFIRNYIGTLNHFYDLTTLDRTLRFFICLRPAPYEDKRAHNTNRSIKDGVHIECPDLVLHSEHQQIIRHKMLLENGLYNAFEGTGYVNQDKDVFDESVVKKTGWFFYGEGKADIPAYTLSSVYVYDPTSGEYDDQEPTEYTTRELLKLLSIRYDILSEPVTFNEETHEEWNNLHAEITNPSVEHNTNNATENAVTTFPTWLVQGHTDEEIQFAKDLALNCLSAERADNYSTWIEVGFALNAIDPSEEMFNVWMKFSDKSGKSGGNNVNQLYREWSRNWNRRDTDRKFTIRSLHLWAQHDNPVKYQEIKEGNIIHYIENNLDATHTHVARLMWRMYKNDYRAAVDSKKVEWYDFKGNAWKKLAQGIEIRNKMTTEVTGIIDKAKASSRRIMVTFKEGSAEHNFAKARVDNLHKIEKNLYSAGFKDSVMKECVGLFYEDEFAQKLNSNQFLIGFANGVVDLHAERTLPNGQKEYFVQFREGKPEDYISFMAGRWVPKQCDPINYVPYDPSDPDHAEIDTFMELVFPRKDLREYMWRKLASCLEGTNREQTYETWIGVGGNGKSKLVDLVSMTLGDYATSLQSTALTRKRPESGAANPDIMAIRNKRFIYMAEPDDREPLNTSRMKQFTGEDVVEARGLFEDQTKFQITGKMFMLCNAFPAINTMDRGTWRRVRAVPFESKFVDPQSPDIDPSKNIYPRDNFLDIKLKRWRAAFMSRLIHIYETQYMRNGLEPVPAIIKQESDKYREMFDSFGKFKGARIREESGSEATLAEIWRVYKNWAEGMSLSYGKRLSQQELQKRLDDEFGQPFDKKTYKRIILFTSDEEIEEYENDRKNPGIVASAA